MSGLSSWGYLGTAAGLLILGTPHCLGMCGPIAAQISGRGGSGRYQAGRFVGYAAIGALAGAFGERFLALGAFSSYLEISALLVVFLLIVNQAIASARGMPEATLAGELYAALHRSSLAPILRTLQRTGPLGIGFANAFLPCGMIASFVLLAASARSPFIGVFLFGLLWFGSLLPLTLAAWGSGYLRSRTPLRLHRVASALLFLAIGVGALATRGASHGSSPLTASPTCPPALARDVRANVPLADDAH